MWLALAILLLIILWIFCIVGASRRRLGGE